MSPKSKTVDECYQVFKSDDNCQISEQVLYSGQKCGQLSTSDDKCEMVLASTNSVNSITSVNKGQQLSTIFTSVWKK